MNEHLAHVDADEHARTITAEQITDFQLIEATTLATSVAYDALLKGDYWRAARIMQIATVQAAVLAQRNDTPCDWCIADQEPG